MPRYSDERCEAVVAKLLPPYNQSVEYHEDFKTREEAKQAIFEYIEVFYNRERLHSSNDYMNPADYESMLRTTA